MSLENGSAFKTIALQDAPVMTDHWDGHEAKVVVEVEGRQLYGYSSASSVHEAYTGAFFDALSAVIPELRAVGFPNLTVASQNGHSYADLSLPVGSERLLVRQDGNVNNRDLGKMVAFGINAAVQVLKP